MVYSAEDVEHAKPSPQGIQMIMRRFGVGKNETVMIGDTSADIEAGRLAGVTTVGITHGFTSRAQMQQLTPDHIIHSLDKLRTVLYSG